jgi:ABC-2 type transport system permease protein
MATAEQELQPAAEARPPRAGWRVVARKEIADHLLSVRFVVLIVLVGLAASIALYAGAGGLRELTPEQADSPRLFLDLFTVVPEGLPSFLGFLGLVSWLVPLFGIAFGFDAVSSERSQGTLPRLVAQPIHRDDVINGKFAGGLAVIAIALTSLTVLVAGLGMFRLGIVPTSGQVGRMLIWLALTILYAGFWLAFSTLCSVAFRGAATSVLVAIFVWLVLAVFAPLILFRVASDVLAPVPDQPTIEEQLRNIEYEQRISRLSPTTLYAEATDVLLNPRIQFLGTLLVPAQDIPRILPVQLSLDQSLLLVWPQTVALVALTVLCFAAAYILFMRQEIRA